MRDDMQYLVAVAMTLHMRLGDLQERLPEVGTVMDTRTFRMERKIKDLRNLVQTTVETIGSIDDNIEFSIQVRPLTHKAEIIQQRAHDLGQRHWESMIALDGEHRDGSNIFYRGRKSATPKELSQRMESIGHLFGQCTAIADTFREELAFKIVSAFPPKRRKR